MKMKSLKYEIRSFVQWGVVLSSVLSRAEYADHPQSALSLLPGYLTGILQRSATGAAQAKEVSILQDNLSAIVAQALHPLSKLQHLTQIVENSAMIRMDQAVEVHDITLSIPKDERPTLDMSDAQKKSIYTEYAYRWITKQHYPGQFTATGSAAVLRCYVNEVSAIHQSRYESIMICID